MIPIYLCDDNAEQLQFYKKKINDFILIEEYDMKVNAAFQKPTLLLDELKKNTPTNGIYFLDVDLKAEKNGIELASDIRLLDSRGFIIFITTHEEMAFKTFQYQVEALDYIIKDSPDFLSQIHRCLQNIWKRYLQQTTKQSITPHLKVNASGTIRLLPSDDIIFIEASSASHKVKIHIHDETIELYGSLKDLNEKLDKLYTNSPFVYSHKACLVNLDHISSLDKVTKIITFDDEATTSCSSRQYKIILKLLHKN